MRPPMKRGLGLAGGPMTAGSAVPMPADRMGGRAEPMPSEGGYADELDMQGAPDEIDPQSKGTYGDGLSDLQRQFRDEVEGDQDGGLYDNLDAWQDKWLRRAKELGLGWEEAWQVLDSIADLDPPEEGYGDEAWPE